MENTLKFKTNINCSGCVARVTPSLNSVKGITNWNVDTSASEKILTIQSNQATEEEIKNAVKSAGFNIENL